MILGVQPEVTDLGEELSIALRKAANEISQMLIEIISTDNA